MSLQALSNQIQTNPLSYTIIGEILKQERSQLFRKVGSDRTRENYFKLKEETFILDTREKLKVFCLFVVFGFVCLFFWGGEFFLLRLFYSLSLVFIFIFYLYSDKPRIKIFFLDPHLGLYRILCYTICFLVCSLV